MSKDTPVWGVISDYGFMPVHIVRETAKCFYHDYWGGRETRRDKSCLLDWRGSEADARKLTERLTSAKAEMNRRKRAASDWFVEERDKIIADAMLAHEEPGK